MNEDIKIVMSCETCSRARFRNSGFPIRCELRNLPRDRTNLCAAWKLSDSVRKTLLARKIGFDEYAAQIRKFEEDFGK